MLGGGFLKQMADTMKSNRALLRRKKKHKPFDKTESTFRHSPDVDDTFPDRNLSEKDRKAILDEVRRDAKRNIIKRILILSFSLATAAFLFWKILFLGVKR